MGFGEIGGMGRESIVCKQLSDCWVFRGQRTAPPRGDGIRTLEWTLKENQMAPGEFRDPEFHTAFAFEHSQRPVYMRVEVQGELSSKSRQWMNKLATFGSVQVSSDVDLSR